MAFFLLENAEHLLPVTNSAEPSLPVSVLWTSNVQSWWAYFLLISTPDGLLGKGLSCGVDIWTSLIQPNLLACLAAQEYSRKGRIWACTGLSFPRQKCWWAVEKPPFQEVKTPRGCLLLPTGFCGTGCVMASFSCSLCKDSRRQHLGQWLTQKHSVGGLPAIESQSQS